jgi:hypothetical protein
MLHLTAEGLQRGLAISRLYCCCALGMWYWCEAALVYMGQVGLESV